MPHSNRARRKTLRSSQISTNGMCAMCSIHRQSLIDLILFCHLSRDVRSLSSKSYAMHNGTGDTNAIGSIGMSQLVATMLETVHAMWLAGTSAYQCMSFMESKLQEMYLQSETLAAFLLATEFCSLNTVTTALNLSANDVPLLLSVASIHSPQVTKKYGISFR